MSDESLKADVATEVVNEGASEDVKQSEPAEDVKQDVEEGDDAEKAEATVEEEEHPEVKKTREGMQKRIDRQTAALRSAEEKLRLAEQRIEEINKSSPVQEDKAPNMDDYDTVEEYTEAMAEYRADKIVKDKLKAEREAELQKAQQAKFEQMTKSFEEREASFRAENPEYKSNQENFEYNFNMINSQGKTPATQTIAQVLMERNSAPALINELGRNEDLLHELSSMSPVEAVFKLAELERDISSRKKVKREEVPPPVKSVNGTGKGKKSVSNMNVDEAMKWFNS